MFHTYEWSKILEVLLQLVKGSHKLKHDDLGFMYKEYDKLFRNIVSYHTYQQFHNYSNR